MHHVFLRVPSRDVLLPFEATIIALLDCVLAFPLLRRTELQSSPSSNPTEHLYFSVFVECFLLLQDIRASNNGTNGRESEVFHIDVCSIKSGWSRIAVHKTSNAAFRPNDLLNNSSAIHESKLLRTCQCTGSLNSCLNACSLYQLELLVARRVMSIWTE